MTEPTNVLPAKISHGNLMPIAGIAPPSPTDLTAKEFALFKIGDPNQVVDLMRENLGNDGLSFSSLTSVSWPSGGAGKPAWMVDTAEGPKAFTELPVVILRYRDGRVLWGSKFGEKDGSGEPPVCISENKLVGVGQPGGECAVCPLNQWGSARDDAGNARRGKACQERRRLFVIAPFSLLPLHFNVPPTSIKPIQQYFAKLVGMGLPYYAVKTKMRLTTGANKDGTAYAELGCEMMGRLSDDEVRVFRAINLQFDPIFSATSVVPDQQKEADDEAEAQAASRQASGESSGAANDKTPSKRRRPADADVPDGV